MLLQTLQASSSSLLQSIAISCSSSSISLARSTSFATDVCIAPKAVNEMIKIQLESLLESIRKTKQSTCSGSNEPVGDACSACWVIIIVYKCLFVGNVVTNTTSI
jgi:hypothetical protein